MKKYIIPRKVEDTSTLGERIEILKSKASRELNNIIILKPEIFNDKGENIFEKKQISNREMSKLTGLSAQTISQWVSNKDVNPSIYALEELTKIFKISVDWLLAKDTMPETFKDRELKLFKEFGFSDTAYKNLCRFKENDIDMEKIMYGINQLLSDSFLLDIIYEGKISDEEKLNISHFPTLLYLSQFFSLYEDGLEPKCDTTLLGAMMGERVTKSSIQSFDAEELRAMMVSCVSSEEPYVSDSTAMELFCTELRRIKQRLIDKTLEKLYERNEILPKKERIESIPISAIGELAQIRALEELQSKYNSQGSGIPSWERKR